MCYLYNMRAALLISAFAAGCATPAEDPNAVVLDLLRAYPTDGSFGYYWPRADAGKDAAWDGTTEEIQYRGEPLTMGDPARRSYCCGLTYEVFLKALLRLHGPDIPGVSADHLRETRRRWYGDSKQAPERRRLAAFALESMGFGRAVASFEDARPGDFVQFWRASGSGHSAVFLDWTREKGHITGLRYWSSQKSTDGIGTAMERIGGKDGIKPDEIYLGRLVTRP